MDDESQNKALMAQYNQLIVPCISRYEDLIAKYAGKLEIRCCENGKLAAKKICVPAKEFGKSDITSDLSESNNLKKSGPIEKPTTRRSSRSSSGSSSSSADSLDKLRFRAPQPPPFKKTTSTTSTNSTIPKPSTDISFNAQSTHRQSTQQRRPDEAKPGTVGSRQTVNPSQRGKRRQQQQVVNQQKPNIFGSLKISSSDNVIDTKNFVEDTMIMFLPELCKRTGVEKPPKDPMDLCLKFNLIVPDLDLETEPECIDISGDGD